MTFAGDLLQADVQIGNHRPATAQSSVSKDFVEPRVAVGKDCARSALHVTPSKFGFRQAATGAAEAADISPFAQPTRAAARLLLP